MSETLSAYLAFLWEQFQYDWGWLSNPWLFAIGNILYLIFFTVKWTVLLTPITLPLMIWKYRSPVYVILQDHKKNKNLLPPYFKN